MHVPHARCTPQPMLAHVHCRAFHNHGHGLHSLSNPPRGAAPPAPAPAPSRYAEIDILCFTIAGGGIFPGRNARLGPAGRKFDEGVGLESEQASEQLEDLDEAPDTARVCEPMKDR